MSLVDCHVISLSLISRNDVLVSVMTGKEAGVYPHRIVVLLYQITVYLLVNVFDNVCRAFHHHKVERLK